MAMPSLPFRQKMVHHDLATGGRCPAEGGRRVTIAALARRAAIAMFRRFCETGIPLALMGVPIETLADPQCHAMLGPAMRGKVRMATETFYDVMRRQGITRRSFTKFCSLTAAALGLPPAYAADIQNAMETKPRIPVLWMHGLECTCCSESFIRSGHPLAKDVILSMISLDYDDTLMAAAGHQAEAIVQETIQKYDGNFILAVEGNPPLNQEG
jgi:hypothetical protein